MKSNISKNSVNSILLILLLSFSTIAASLTIAEAHTPPWEIQPYLYITATPNPIGVGQPATIVFWLNWIPPTAMGSAGDRWLFYLDIISPDDAKQTVGPLTSDPVGGSYYIFTPETTGNYTFTARFGPQTVTGSTGTGIYNDMGFGGPILYLNDTFLEASGTTSITVQEEPIPSPPIYPLPTEYWTRPIEGQNDNWYVIGSNWLGPQQAARFQPDGTAPSSAHVMWTKPMLDGGVVGGTGTGIDGMTYYDGTAYEGRFGTPLVIYGRLYYAVPKSNSATGGGYNCVDLRTGELIFWQNMTMPSFAQLYDYESFNQHGVIPNGYLWSVSGGGGYGAPATPTNWTAYDPLTGNWLYSMYNVPPGAGSSTFGTTTYYTPNGEIVFYQLNATAKWLALWNNTDIGAITSRTNVNDTTSSGFFQWRPIGKTVDASAAFSWNVTIPTLPGPSPAIVKVIPDDIALGTSSSFAGITAWGTPNPWTMWAISLDPSSRGQLLWTKNYNAPPGNQTLLQGPVDPTNRVFTMWSRDALTFSGYSMDNGDLLWTSQPEDAWGFYSTGWSVAYGNLYHSGYGTIYAYDCANGNVIWNFSVPSGLATPYTNYPLAVNCVADGKIYLGTAEHSRNAPYWKDTKTYCLNATTGEVIWSLDAATPSSAGGIGQVSTGFAIADGFYTYLNLYDNQIYTIGKGPSQTAVTASPKVSVLGSSVLIEGNVIDLSSGTTQAEQAARFPTGVPAVSDESMSDWMQYVYMQKPRPDNTVGVPVSLDVIDSNGNYRNIGEATSDENGFYSYQWNPDIAGKYTIIATFGGTESYWPSHSETAVAVDETTTPATATAAPPSTMVDTYFLPSVIAIIIILIIGFAITILVLRKRP
jgi:hypothetical protein